MSDTTDELTIRDALTKFTTKRGQFKKYTGRYGLEIETEASNSYTIPKMKYWNDVSDGSLRNFGVEYVLKQPLSLDGEMDSALKEFDDVVPKNLLIKDSISTSVHVHINFLEETFLTMSNFLVTYTLLENLLCEFSGADRKSNLFCLSMNDAQQTAINVCNMLRSIKTRQYKGIIFHPNLVKYAALNLGSLGQLGTLEIRTFRGETDTKVIREWVAILDKIVTFSKNKDLTPIKIVELFRNTKAKFPHEILGNTLGNKVSVKNTVEMIEKNLWFAARMASTTRKWEDFGQPVVKRVTKAMYQNDLDNLGKSMFNKSFKELNWVESKVVQEELSNLLETSNIRVIFDEGGDI